MAKAVLWPANTETKLPHHGSSCQEHSAKERRQGPTEGWLGQVKAEEVVRFGTVFFVTHDQFTPVPTLEAVVLMHLLLLCFYLPFLLLQFCVSGLLFICRCTRRLAVGGRSHSKTRLERFNSGKGKTIPTAALLLFLRQEQGKCGSPNIVGLRFPSFLITSQAD